MTKDKLIQIHKTTIYNRKALRKTNKCGCFYCLEIFDPKEIEDWIDGGTTAICPYCRIDSVLQNTKEVPVTKELLKEMHDYFF